VKILVTGGAGFVGSHLVDALLAAGHAVRVLDSLEPQVHGPERRAPEWLDRRAELVVGDVRDRAAVARALEGVEAVFHEAAAVGVAQSMYEIERFVSVNSVGTAVLLEEIVARRDRIRRMVVASSNTIYGEGSCRAADGRPLHPGPRPEAQLAARRFEPEDEAGRPLTPVPTAEDKPLRPTTVYAITKRDHEELFLTVGSAYGIPAVALRYFNIYGPRQTLSNPYTGVMAIFSARLRNGNRPIVFEDGLQTRDFVHVSDIVRANLLALESDAAPGGTYNVGTGQATPVGRVAELLGEALGTGLAPDVTHRYRPGDVRHCFADIGRARRDLGYEPRVALADGLRELLAWQLTQPAEDRVAEATRELERRGLTR
jgi:dTDP-L-rhamnose 4-epimerase